MSAIFLPFNENESIDWDGFHSHLERTEKSGITPAVNMDTGSIQFLDEADRLNVLNRAAGQTSKFVAGACVVDREGDSLDLKRYKTAVAEIVERGGTPVIFPSWGLNALDGDEWVDALLQITAETDQFIGFELGSQFVPYGRIYDLNTWSQLLEMPNCIGAKHSSLQRSLEWDRLVERDKRNPDFMVLTGNDLAIDMVMYGSDYLLGLSTFAPELFAKRDQYWVDGDREFYALNDLLQYLGEFVFRDPVPSYKHSAAQFLNICGTLNDNQCPPGILPRPDSDLLILEDIARRLELI